MQPYVEELDYYDCGRWYRSDDLRFRVRSVGELWAVHARVKKELAAHYAFLLAPRRSAAEEKRK